MSLSCSAETIPPLKDKHNNWVTTAPEKANLLADIFLENHASMMRLLTISLRLLPRLERFKVADFFLFVGAT